MNPSTYLWQRAKVKRNWIIAFALLFITFTVWGYFYNNRIATKTFNKFNSANINGKLMWVGVYNKGCGFQVIGNTDIFDFAPYTDKVLNGGHIFDSFAQPGDSVVKPPYSDTLFLIKNNKIYKYTFFKLPTK